MCNLKKYHILNFLVSKLDNRERNEMISCLILFSFYDCFLKNIYLFFIFKNELK